MSTRKYYRTFIRTLFRMLYGTLWSVVSLLCAYEKKKKSRPQTLGASYIQRREGVLLFYRHGPSAIGNFYVRKFREKFNSDSFSVATSQCNSCTFQRGGPFDICGPVHFQYIFIPRRVFFDFKLLVLFVCPNNNCYARIRFKYNFVVFIKTN